jgi:hypothetical protein
MNPIDNFTVDVDTLDAEQFSENAELAEQSMEYSEEAQALAQQQQQMQKAEAEGTAQQPQQQQAEGGGGPQYGKPQELDPNDSRANDTFEFSDITNEIGAAVTGGGMKTVSSLATAPERLKDMFSGEMKREQEEKGYYEPEFNPLGNKRPMTTTWWGGFIEGGVHFGTMALGMLGIAKLGAAAGVGGAAGAALKWVGGMGVGSTFAGNAARAGVAGMVTDALSEESHAHNATGALKERFPWLDNPIATRDTDDPSMIYFKNIAEGLGIGYLADGVRWLISGRRAADVAAGTMAPGKPEQELTAQAIVDADRQVIEADAIERAKFELDRDLTNETAVAYYKKNGVELSKLPEIEREAEKYAFAKGKKRYEEWSSYQESAIDRSIRQADERSASVENQIVEEGVRQVESPEYGAFKDKPISDPWQAAPQSEPRNMFDAIGQSRRLNNSWDPDQGSLSPLTTPAGVRRANEVVDVEGKDLEKAYRQLVGERKHARVMEQLKKNNVDIKQFFKENYESYREFTEGRNTTNMTLEEYFEPIETQARFQTGGDDNYTAWAMKNVVIGDLINASNFKILRDSGVMAREIKDVADIFDVDGPMRVVADRLAYGIMQVKRSRYLISTEFRKLQTVQGSEKAAAAFRKRMADMHQESKEGVTAMMQIMQKSNNPALQDTLLEAFSMSDKIRNWEDLWQLFNRKLKGGDFDGKVNTGMLIKEIQGTIIHSVLSGPKTPIRAIMGTGTASFMRPMAQAMGGMMARDGAQIRLGLAGTNAIIQALPEAWTLFKTNLRSYWAGEMSTYRTKNFTFEKAEQDWEAMGEMIKMRKENGESLDGMEGAYQLATMVRGLNNNNLLTYSTKIMAATDDTFGYLMARARSREKAMLRSEELMKKGEITEVTPELIKAYEDNFYQDLLDPDGNINFTADAALNHAREEVTLTRDLSGFAKSLDTTFEKAPWAKPFLLFARTGVNGIEMTMKHMPLFNRLVKDSRRILNATPEMVDQGLLKDVGIETMEDLAASKAIMKGRVTMGAAVTTMAGVAFMNGDLHGNGPMDRKQRQMWIDSGYKTNSIRLGGVWVNFSALEPFGQILNYVADVGDNMQLMGPEWAEEKLQRLALVLTSTTVSKSYLAGLQQFVDVVSSNKPGKLENMIANLANNTVPLGGLRNEIGKVLNPYMKELRSGLGDSIRNRNQLTEHLAGKPLAIKYDILTGKPINDWDFPTRMYNAISPVQINLDSSPGRTLLWQSGYDLRITAYNNPGGVNLKDAPEVRSMYQREIGKQNLEAKLNALAEREDVQESLAKMETLRRQGRDDMDPMDFKHNDLIAKMFAKAQRKAWGRIQSMPEVQRLIEAKRHQDAAVVNMQKGASLEKVQQRLGDADEVLNMPIK